MISAKDYLSRWDHMLSDWAGPGINDRAWLLYSANYLFHTNGVRWAIDPLALHWRIPSMPDVDISSLAALDFIVLTHGHADHLDLSLLRRLKDFPIKWVIPEFLLKNFDSLHLTAQNVIIPQPLQTIHLGGISLTPFNGLHLVPDDSLPGGQRGVPELGYLAEFNQKRWLFPGDTRLFDSNRVPSFGPVDGLCMHVWLGKGQAEKSHPTLLESFCQFCLELKPKRILLTHLHEWGRSPEEMWTDIHATMIVNWFAQNAPGTPIQSAILGDQILM